MAADGYERGREFAQAIFDAYEQKGALSLDIGLELLGGLDQPTLFLGLQHELGRLAQKAVAGAGEMVQEYKELHRA